MHVNKGRLVHFASAMFLYALAALGPAPAHALRSLSVADLFRLVRLPQPWQIHSTSLSPDGDTLAFVVQRPRGTARNMAVNISLVGNAVSDVWLVSLRARHARNLTHGELTGSGYWSPQWSPDGNYLAMLSTLGGNIHLWAWNKHNGSFTRLSSRPLDGGLIAKQFAFAWVSGNRILARFLPTGTLSSAITDVTANEQIAMHMWPAAWRGHTVTSSTIESGVPGSLSGRPKEDLAIVSLDRGKVRVQELARSVHFTDVAVQQGRVTFLSETGVWSPRPGERLLQAHGYDLGTYTPGSVSFDPQPAPSPHVPTKSQSYNFYVVNDRTGTYLREQRNGVPGSRTLFTTNTFLQRIAQAQIRSIAYTGTDGAPLHGCLILPLGYQAGKHYPTVVYVYAGLTIGASECSRDGEIPSPYQFFPAHGYALLLPSMPLPSHPPLDNYTHLLTGVLPAMGEAAALGIADPQRFAVVGHSYGGYSAMGIIEQTDRFKAAIACAGLSDVTSAYGTFNQFPTRTRYYNDARQMEMYLWSPYWAEEGQQGIKNPPWADPQRYLQNSPLTYVDRVHTPVLLMHGDDDEAVPIQQSEEFFTALYRQGKRAEFVRYWGEKHVFYGEANTKDAWRRIFSWLDRYDK